MRSINVNGSFCLICAAEVVGEEIVTSSPFPIPMNCLFNEHVELLLGMNNCEGDRSLDLCC